METNTAVWFKTLLVCSIALLASSCSRNELTRTNAEELLDTDFANSFKESEALDPSLRRKPEFDSLKTLQFATIHTEVIGIHKVSETEATVEYRIVEEANKENLQKWLVAFARLNRRLNNLPFIKIDLWNWGYRDPYDGQTFTPNAGVVMGRYYITQTGGWQELQDKQAHVNMLIVTGTVKSRPGTAELSLYDDGWRLVKNQ